MTGTLMTAAALAGVPAGVQAQGVWAGRRQLFVRFAGEAETATMYTAAALCARSNGSSRARSSTPSPSVGATRWRTRSFSSPRWRLCRLLTHRVC